MPYKFDLINITDLTGLAVRNHDHIIINVIISIKKDNVSKNFVNIDKKRDIYRINLPLLYTQVQYIYPEFTQHITNYIPLGDIVINSNTRTINLFMANILYVPTSKIYEPYKHMGMDSDKLWYALIRKGDRVCQSIGLIRSDDRPVHAIPVFQKEYMIRINRQNLDHNYISNKDYGFWILNKHLLANKITQSTYKIISDTDIMTIDDEGDIANQLLYNGDQSDDFKKPVLQERENPWFENPLIIGHDPTTHQAPYKIIGIALNGGKANRHGTAPAITNDRDNMLIEAYPITNNQTILDDDNYDQTNNQIIIIMLTILFFLFLYRMIKK